MPPDFGVYVHVPYCRERCLYCDFALIPVDSAPSAAFANAVIAELGALEFPAPGVDVASRFAGRTAVSVYFGGGTPSMLAPADVGRILAAIDGRFGLATGAEVTLEANPEDAEPAPFAGFRAAGINRVSLGVQALDDRTLAALGRKHDAAQARASIAIARGAGIENVSLDLIFGVMGMTLAGWRETLAAAISLHPSHVSCYGLTVERGTRLDRMVTDGSAILLDEDLEADMYEAAGSLLGDAGLPRYEVSSYAAKEHRARHNSLYWRYAEWIGVGPAAHSFVRAGPERSPVAGGIRWWNGKNPAAWLDAKGLGQVAGHERITGRAAMGEMAFTALRHADGLADADFEAVFGVEPGAIFGDAFRRLTAIGLLARGEGRVHLTERGFPVSDSIFRDLVEAAPSV